MSAVKIKNRAKKNKPSATLTQKPSRKIKPDAFANKANESSPPLKRTTLLAHASAPLFQHIAHKYGFATVRFFIDWPTIIGAHLAAGTQPLRLVCAPGRQSHGVLHIQIAGGGLALEIQHIEPQLKQRINLYFGYCAVARLKLHQGPLTTSALTPNAITNQTRINAKNRTIPPITFSEEQKEILVQQTAMIQNKALRAALTQFTTTLNPSEK